MGWANCGLDSKGRPIGYAFEATCDEPGCTKVIDRGLAYACGGMHGEDEWSCEGYFCETHRMYEPRVEEDDVGPLSSFVCKSCGHPEDE